MKRICCVAGALLITIGAARAKAAAEMSESDSARSFTPVEIAFAAPLQIPWWSCDVEGLRLNLISGRSRSVTGLDLGFFGAADEDFRGLAVDAAGLVGGNAYGASIAALGNAAIGNACGLMVAGAVNYVRGDFAGLQLAAANIDGSFIGCQLGVVNRNSGMATGCQLGLWNSNRTESSIWSLGAVNVDVKFAGVQIGLVNSVTENGSGLQIGVFNSAAKFSGCQIGLLNLLGNAEIPVLPVANFAF